MLGADQLAHLRDRHVVLPDVHPVGAHLARDVRAVVDDQQRAEPLAERSRGVGDRDQLLVGKVLLAQLHDVHAAGDRLAQQAGQRGSGGGGVGARPIGDRPTDEVQPRGGEARAPIGAESLGRT